MDIEKKRKELEIGGDGKMEHVMECEWRDVTDRLGIGNDTVNKENDVGFRRDVRTVRDGLGSKIL